MLYLIHYLPDNGLSWTQACLRFAFSLPAAFLSNPMYSYRQRDVIQWHHVLVRKRQSKANE